MLKLFWKDPYLTECTAKVTSIDGTTVKLDQTIFFAFSGGQASDEGTIGGIKVLEARKLGDKESVVDIEYHIEKEPDFSVGDEVIVTIDTERRLKLMKLHSAVHILHYLFFEKIGKELECIGSNISPDKGRIDYLYETPITPMLPELQEKMNALLAQNIPIEQFPDENNKDLLYWRCNGWKMPCGGTHVRNTTEIGKIILKRKNIGAEKERFEVLLA